MSAETKSEHLSADQFVSEMQKQFLQTNCQRRLIELVDPDLQSLITKHNAMDASGILDKLSKQTVIRNAQLVSENFDGSILVEYECKEDDFSEANRSESCVEDTELLDRICLCSLFPEDLCKEMAQQKFALEFIRSQVAETTAQRFVCSQFVVLDDEKTDDRVARSTASILFTAEQNALLYDLAKDFVTARYGECGGDGLARHSNLVIDKIVACFDHSEMIHLHVDCTSTVRARVRVSTYDVGISLYEPIPWWRSAGPGFIVKWQLSNANSLEFKAAASDRADLHVHFYEGRQCGLIHGTFVADFGSNFASSLSDIAAAHQLLASGALPVPVVVVVYKPFSCAFETAVEICRIASHHRIVLISSNHFTVPVPAAST